jgi:hypothetical protein
MIPASLPASVERFEEAIGRPGILLALWHEMSNETNNPAPHAGEKEVKRRKDGQTPGMAQPPSQGERSKDPENPASKPQGTTADQVANMESEGQAQEATDPNDKDATASVPRFDKD